jgi:Lrp/AsnC family leucine-responsive transcriptional regulator
MDKFDLKILQLLKENARQPISKIADQVSLSRSAVTERIKKLEDNGTIRGYQVLLTQAMEEQVTVYLEIRFDDIQCGEIASKFRTIAEIKICHGVAGDTDMMLLIKAATMARVHAIRDTISSIAGVKKITTHVVMAEYINDYLDGMDFSPIHCPEQKVQTE